MFTHFKSSYIHSLQDLNIKAVIPSTQSPEASSTSPNNNLLETAFGLHSKL